MNPKKHHLRSNSTIFEQRKLANFLYGVYILAILVLLVIPPSDGIKLNKIIFGIRTDLVIHATMFVPFMAYFWFQDWVQNSFRRFIRFFGYGILFAACCESLHLIIPYRSFDIVDFFANVTGLTIGSSIFFVKRNRI
ncbi:MAG: VanZ family protein [Crocinitomicaceae bacterium]|nr:MAG: VanZ family protein [Crocinitomicaceae bacterium]